MTVSTGNISAAGSCGFGTGPAGKARINRMGQSHAPAFKKTVTNRGSKTKVGSRGSILRGTLGKRGR